MFEAGKVYRTKSGKLVLITTIDDTPMYPLRGNVYNANYDLELSVAFTEKGNFYATNDSVLDLVEEVTGEELRMFNVMLALNS